MPLTRRFDDAFVYAHETHGDHTRKGNGVPYIGHLMGVASIVIDDGGTEDEAIAALLHDAPEDRGGRDRLEDIRARFGDDVAKIVEDCTDSWTMPKAPWAERKKQYVEHARTLSAVQPARLGRRQGPQRLRDPAGPAERRATRCGSGSTRSADDILAYYQSLVRSYREAGGGRLVDELDRIVRAIEREMGY